MTELPEAMVERVARSIVRTSRNYDIYHMPGDEPRQWRPSGGAIFQTTPLPMGSAERVRTTARAALEAAGVGDLLEALREAVALAVAASLFLAQDEADAINADARVRCLLTAIACAEGRADD